MAAVIFSPSFNENHNPTFPHKERLKVSSKRAYLVIYSINLISGGGFKNFHPSLYFTNTAGKGRKI